MVGSDGRGPAIQRIIPETDPTMNRRRLIRFISLKRQPTVVSGLTTNLKNERN